jgi:uncharacterized RDD family membrane protein YckC
MGYTPRTPKPYPRPQTRARMFTDGSYSQLPDPVRQSAFYDSVTLKRGLAWIVDSIIVAILVFIALAFTAFLGAFFFFAFWMVISFAYRVVTIANGSATWGMRLMAIEFRDWRGEKLDFGQAFMHTLGYTVAVSVAPLQIVSIVCMFATERGQGLSDLLLGTTALNKRA